MVSTSDGGLRPHDPALLEALATFSDETFDGKVFRVTGRSADPLAFSQNGGRWAPPSSYLSVPILYTGLTRETALAEVASYLALVTPTPSRIMVLHHLQITARRVVRLSTADLERLGISAAAYSERNYARPGQSPPSRSQEIGAALSFLGFDGLIAPSARWPGDNLMVFQDNHRLDSTLEAVEKEEIDWRIWMDEAGLKIDGGG
jgi:RES domain-containing protein